MAQKKEKDETKFKVIPKAIMLCVKCGVAPTNDLHKNYFSATAVGSASTVVTMVVGSKKSFRSNSSLRSSPEMKLKPVEISKSLKKEDLDSTEVVQVKREVNRCSDCRRKVGLTKFRCRCCELFYANHRYSYRHDCSYDYKAAGREAISRENPVVKAAKIVKICRNHYRLYTCIYQSRNNVK
ncbi:zinc finger A20 and AN1 domain-containing stress-associated protein 5-like [Olea europaea var. sylvestris]|uniref:zinc finger A20 and AN1 domain-containing stress-associated protein 5-like n=1 Tax=Olea europaea var. sylvestris TaxID=158386 RepID=UPI000C1D6795|nr:zinc finger A20 and AN1 domain-containing stress-associated protein 5-like [Olea europaea var. sylvestris]